MRVSTALALRSIPQVGTQLLHVQGQSCPNSSYQLTGVRGLGRDLDIAHDLTVQLHAAELFELPHVVRAWPGQAQTVLQVLGGRPHGQEDHGHGQPQTTDALAHVEAVHVRVAQLYVQHYQVRMRGFSLVDGLISVHGLDAVEAVVLQGGPDE